MEPTAGTGSRPSQGPVRQISAVTLHSSDMAEAVRFYEACGFRLLAGGPDAAFSTFEVGGGYLNVQLRPDQVRPVEVWGRIVFWVDDVARQYRRVIAAGYRPDTRPADAPWGERYFHVRDPDGHEVSFARPLPAG